MNNDKLNEIVKRLHGDFFVSCVGPVRSGKSTFINKFMNLKILPYITDDYLKNKILDELPQTSAGKQIMTVEPKFVPSEAINVNIGDINMNLRMVDSVGFVIPSALGYQNDDGPRLVKTPWLEEPIDFKEAARIGTEKIMENHSNLAIVLTSDGSFNDFTKEEYDEVLNEVVSKMKTLGKPFVIVLNTAYPKKEETIQMVEEMSLKYDESVYACNVINMEEADVDQIFTLALSEFEIETLTYKLPEILDVLGNDIKLKSDLNEIIMSKDLMARKVKDVSKITDKIKSIEDIEDASLDLDGGNVTVNIIIKNDYVKTLINNLCDFEVNTKADLIKALYNGHRALILEKQYGKALESCNETGYGVAIPAVENMKMLPPTVIKQAGRYGVKVEAIAPSIHFIKVDIKSSFAPIIGSLEQSKSLIDSLDGDDSKIWDKEIFGRKISEIVNDGVKQKVYALPETSKEKLKDVMNKLLNSNRNSLIAIVL